jgi:hypothetical protein
LADKEHRELLSAEAKANIAAVIDAELHKHLLTNSGKTEGDARRYERVQGQGPIRSSGQPGSASHLRLRARQINGRASREPPYLWPRAGVANVRGSHGRNRSAKRLGSAEAARAWIGLHAEAWRKATELEVLPEADALHALLVRLADELDGWTEGSPEEAEYISLVEVIEAYEEKRWPDGKIPGGKG